MPFSNFGIPSWVQCIFKRLADFIGFILKRGEGEGEADKRLLLDSAAERGAGYDGFVFVENFIRGGGRYALTEGIGLLFL